MIDPMIKHLTRGTIVFEFEGKTATLQGEASLRGYGSPDYVVYENSVTRWDPPHQDTAIDDETKKRLLAELLSAFRMSKITAVVE